MTPSFPRLTLVELRKMVDTRAGFWLQLIVALLTLALVVLFCVFADTEDLVFRDMFALAIVPASILLLGLIVLAVAFVVAVVAIAAVGGAWTLSAAVLGQICLICLTAMVTGIAFGALFLSSAPAIVLSFALPLAWTALGSIPFLNDAAHWLDTTRTTEHMTERALTAHEWAQFAASQGVWLVVPLLIGLWRIARGEIRAA
jgi:ABC-2 type transport system permease protein